MATRMTITKAQAVPYRSGEGVKSQILDVVFGDGVSLGLCHWGTAAGADADAAGGQGASPAVTEV